MKYQVSWHPEAEAELARLWLDMPNRQEVAIAADRLDSFLGNRPSEIGESRPNSRRIFFETPLGVIYRVIDADKRVFVLRVWHIPKRSKG